MSNRLDELYIHLKRQLISHHDNPFKRKLVIVGSPFLKAYVQSRLASDEEKVAMGVEIVSPKEAVERIVTSFTEGFCPSFSSYLEMLVAATQTVSEMPQEIAPVFADWISTNSTKEARERAFRQLQLARQVAHLLFLDGWYAIGPKEQASNHWMGRLADCVTRQASLRLLTKDPHFFEMPKECLSSIPDEILLFGVSTLCTSFHQFFSRVSSAIPVSYFILSPCMLFWSDICSDREIKKYKLAFRENEVSQGKQEAFCDFVIDRCQLLANCGRIGREFSALLEETVIHSEEAYVTNEWAFHEPHFASVLRSHALSGTFSSSVNLLGVLHNSLLTLAGKADDKIALTSTDESVQLHAAPSLLREVQVLHDRIAAYTKTRQEPLECAEIVVLAPDIELYRPYIERVFYKKALYQIAGEKKAESMPLFSCFWKILELPDTDWSADRLFSLFECTSYRRKCGLASEDLSSIYACMEEGVFQGSSTFESFVERMVALWTSSSGENGGFELDGTLGVALGVAIHTIRALQRDLEPCSTSDSNTMDEWISLLEKLFTTYFACDSQDKEAYLIRRALGRVKRASKNGRFAFTHVKWFFKEAFEELLTEEEMTLQRPIVFTTLDKVGTFSANMVCLLGMSEGLFPRQERSLLRNSGVFWVGKEEPFQSAIDKYRFIEAVLAAKQTLFISYQSYSYDERAPLEPSSCVSDLLQTLDDSCHIEGALPSSKVHVHHRLDTYHALPSVKQEATLQPAAIQIVKKPVYEITVAYLAQVARSPLQPYFQQTLSLYLAEESHSCLDDPFSVVETWTLRLAKKKAFSLPSEKAKVLFETMTIGLPGAMKRASIALFTDEINELQHKALQLGITPERVLKVELAAGCTEAKEIEPCFWRVPAPVFPLACGDKVQITGLIDDLYCQGHLFFGNKSDDALVRNWPKSLLTAYLAERYRLPLQTDCYFLKESKMASISISDPEKLLQQYVAYAASCKEFASCLYPEWVPKLLSLESMPKEQLQSSDPYFSFFLSRASEKELTTQWPLWRKQAQELFVELLEPKITRN